MPTSETGTKGDVQAARAGSQDVVETLITYQVVGTTTDPPASSIAPGQSLLKRVTVEPVNLAVAGLATAADFPAQLSDLATLESIQAELDRIQGSSSNSTGTGGNGSGTVTGNTNESDGDHIVSTRSTTVSTQPGHPPPPPPPPPSVSSLSVATSAAAAAAAASSSSPPSSLSSLSSSSSSSSQATIMSTPESAASFIGTLPESAAGLSTNAHGAPQIVSVLQAGDQSTLVADAVDSQGLTSANLHGKRPLAVSSGSLGSVTAAGGASSGQVVTKVIITKNPNQSQPVAIPAAASGQQIMMMGSQGMSNQLSSPTKTITITPAGGLQSPTKYITTLQGSPSKILQGQKIAVSPVKTPTKIAMIPVSSVSKSPQRIVTSTGQVLTMVPKTVGAAGGTTSLASSASSSVRPPTITMSPSKVIIKQQPLANQSGQKMIVQQLNTVPKMQGIPLSSMANIQPVSVSGSKFQYVRLVTTPASQNQTSLATASAKPASIAPMTLQAKPAIQSTNTATQPMKIAVPSAAGSSQQQVARPALQQSQQAQRILLPATSQVAIRPSTANAATAGTLTQIRPAGTTGGAGPATLTQLPPGTTIISSGQSLQGVQGFALVPAQYVTQQIGQQLQTQPVGTSVQRQESNSSFVPIASTSVPEQPQARQNINGSLLQEPSGQRPRKPCNCTKSQCLKLYCDCFANGEFCHNCNCTNCANNLEHEEERSRAIKACLDRNPLAFHPKIGKGRGERRHNKGCNCKRSGCLKNYCECYEAKILCTSICRCVGCKNFEESPDRKTLMHLADAAEVRVQQQTSAKAKLSSQIQDLPMRPPQPNSGERYAYTFVTREVAEATCACLIAQAEEAERTRQIEMVQERMVLEEFGRCLMQVIESAGRTKASSPAP